MTARWRPAIAADLDAIVALAARLFPDHPESRSVLGHRLRLSGPTARIAEGADGAALGYLLAHPWSQAVPLALDVPVRALPPRCDALYVHDLALLPEARGQGLAAAAVAHLLAEAARQALPTLTLVALPDAIGFWQRHGYTDQGPADPSYGPAARKMRRAL